MIVYLAQWLAWFRANRLWLASLGAAAAINAILFWLASLAPMGRLPKFEPEYRTAPVEIMIRRLAPPPPPEVSAAETPPVIFPPRQRWRSPPAKPKWAKTGGWEAPFQAPPLHLNLSPCDPADDERMRAPECAAPQEWLRADRDASALFGPGASGMTLDEFAAARGWIKSKPRKGQDALAATTDTTLPEQIFKDAPFPPHAIERSAGP